MSDLSKLADEIIFLDNEEKKTIQFDFSGDLDTGEELDSAAIPAFSASPDEMTITLATASDNIAQCTITTTTVGLYTLKCIAGVSGSAHQYVGRGKIRVQ